MVDKGKNVQHSGGNKDSPAFLHASQATALKSAPDGTLAEAEGRPLALPSAAEAGLPPFQGQASLLHLGLVDNIRESLVTVRKIRDKATSFAVDLHRPPL